ncbi:MAG TPA: type II secretion system F family protein [Terriglobia bacterium]|nr:type II secretion system F family protein [Terriglobia bacterium]
MKFEIENVIIAASALAAFASVIAVGLPFLRGDRFEARLKAVSERRRELANRRKEAYSTRSKLQLGGGSKWKELAIRRFRLQNLLEAKALRIQLAQAGRRGQRAVVNFLFTRISMPIGLLIGSLIYTSLVLADRPFAMRMLVVIGATGLGNYLPQIMLRNRIAKRQLKLQRAYPDALDLIVICVESGMSIEAAFTKVTEQMVEGAPEIAEEFGLTTAELAFLNDRRQALDNLAERTGLPAFKSLSTTLQQSEKYGTPVAVGLRVLAKESRDSRMAAAEKKAAALPPKLTVPMILFFLPVLFLVIAGPAVIQVMQTFKK